MALADGGDRARTGGRRALAAAAPGSRLGPLRRRRAGARAAPQGDRGLQAGPVRHAAAALCGAACRGSRAGTVPALPGDGIALGGAGLSGFRRRPDRRRADAGRDRRPGSRSSWRSTMSTSPSSSGGAREPTRVPAMAATSSGSAMGAASMPDEADFLTRWSRRKAAARREEQTEPAAVATAAERSRSRSPLLRRCRSSRRSCRTRRRWRPARTSRRSWPRTCRATCGGRPCDGCGG